MKYSSLFTRAILQYSNATRNIWNGSAKKSLCGEWGKWTIRGVISFFFWLTIFGMQDAYAGSVTLEPKEIAALRVILAKDTEASAVFESVRRTAIAALNSEPNPADQAVYEGQLMSNPLRIQSAEKFKDMQKIEALAWTWAVSQEELFLTKAREFIFSWARINQSDGNPINETLFEPLIEAYDLIRPSLNNQEKDLIDGWLAEKAGKLQNSTRGRTGNWQSHRLKIIGLIGVVIDDSELETLAYSGFRQHIMNSFNSNGMSIDFNQRDAMHYHLYAVQPLLTLACVAQRRGELLFSFVAPGGASLENAVEFIRPYALNQIKHLEFVSSKVKFDQVRADAGDAQYKPHLWNPNESSSLFREAGCFSKKYEELARMVSEKPEKRYLKWRSVLNAALIIRNNKP